MTRELAMQWTLRWGIRVNALVPGLFHSDMTSAIEADEQAHANATAAILMRRL